MPCNWSRESRSRGKKGRREDRPAPLTRWDRAARRSDPAYFSTRTADARVEVWETRGKTRGNTAPFFRPNPPVSEFRLGTEHHLRDAAEPLVPMPGLGNPAESPAVPRTDCSNWLSFLELRTSATIPGDRAMARQLPGRRAVGGRTRADGTFAGFFRICRIPPFPLPEACAITTDAVVRNDTSPDTLPVLSFRLL